MDSILTFIEKQGDFLPTPDICKQLGGIKSKEVLKFLNGLLEKNCVVREKRGTTFYWKFVNNESEKECGVDAGDSRCDLYKQIIEQQRSEIEFLRRETEIKNEHIASLLNMQTNAVILQKPALSPNTPNNIGEYQTPIPHSIPAHRVFQPSSSPEPFQTPKKAVPVARADKSTAYFETINRFAVLSENAEELCPNNDARAARHTTNDMQGEKSILSTRPPDVQQVSAPVALPKPQAPQVPSQAASKASATSKRKVALMGTSHFCGIYVNEIQKHLTNAQLVIAAYPGATVKHLNIMAEQIVVPEESPDEIVIHCGGNDNFGRRREEAKKVGQELNAREIAEGIVKVGDTCKSNGVRKIYISSLFYINDHESFLRVHEINYFLEQLCTERGFIFINNSFLGKKDLRDRDRVHLGDIGKRKLVDNYISYINQ